MSASNIASALPEMAARRPDAMAIAWPSGPGGHEQITFKELDEESGRLAFALGERGIGRGTRTVLMVPPGKELFALTFALFRAGAVPVMVDPGMGVKSLKACLDEARPEAFIGIPRAHAARILLGWGRKTIRKLVTVGRRFWGGTTYRKLLHGSERVLAVKTTEAEEVAAILFTSGSTGVPKGAVYTHGNFVAQVESLRQMYGIEPGEVDLPTFPLFALFDPALGMSAVIPEMDPTRPARVDPEKILAAIEKFGVTNMFGSPALLHRVGSYGAEHGARLATLKRVVSAGAPVQPAVLERFTSMLPAGAQVHTPYGATEALPVTTIGSDEILNETAAGTNAGEGVCVGRPVAGIEVRVIRIDDEPIATWSDDLVVEDGGIGEIAVKGPVVTREYFGRAASTALAKIADPAGGFWHRMGDLGYLDSKARLWFCGRKTQRVQLSDETLFTVQCEGVFNAHPDVYRTALVGVNGEPVLCVELAAAGADRDRVERELKEYAERHAQTRRIKTFLFHDGFPVDIRHNAKIFREKLAPWAGRALS